MPRRHDPQTVFRFALSVGDQRLADVLARSVARDARVRQRERLLHRLSARLGLSAERAD